MSRLHELSQPANKNVYCTLSVYEYSDESITWLKDNPPLFPSDTRGILVIPKLVDILPADMGYSYTGSNFVGTFNYPDFEEAVAEAEDHLALLAIDVANDARIDAVDMDTRSITFDENGTEYVVDIHYIDNRVFVEIPVYPYVFRLSRLVGHLDRLHTNVIVCSYDLDADVRFPVIPGGGIFKLRNCCPAMAYKNLNYCISKGDVTPEILDEYISATYTPEL